MTGECVRCGIEPTIRREFCTACNAIVNASIRRWVEGGDREQTFKDFANEIGVPLSTALQRRICRARKQ